MSVCTNVPIECNVKDCLKCSDIGVCEECVKSFKVSSSGQSCSPDGGGNSSTVVISKFSLF